MPLLAHPAQIRLTICELAFPHGQINDHITFVKPYPDPSWKTKQTCDFLGLLPLLEQIEVGRLQHRHLGNDKLRLTCI